MKYPFGTLTLTDGAKRRIGEALASGRLSSGELVRQFEQRYAAVVGTAEAVAVSSGTDAVALALATLYDFGAHRGDEVILPALSFLATANAVLMAGLKPVFVDIRRETLNIDPARIEPAVTGRTRAILPVHLMGKPADMDAIREVARGRGLYVIEDAAEAHGAAYKGTSAGALGDMGAFSLYVAHIITTIEGGVVTTDSEEFAAILRSLRADGRACNCKQCVANIGTEACTKRWEGGTDRRFLFERVGFSARMNELEAAVGLGSLEMYDEIIARRRENLTALIQRVDAMGPYLSTFHEEPHERFGPHALPVLVAEPAPFSRDQLVRYLAEHHIDTRSLFQSMPTQCPGYAFLGYRVGDFPEAEYVGRSGFHVGCHQDIGLDHIDYFAETLRRFLKEHA
ncbi:MAG: aminotransferase DegT [Phycisphaerae bacterium SM23_33]|nr:MAG: aminotransferase DegT [Phycisphaerae bacterium SM23_33]